MEHRGDVLFETLFWRFRAIGFLVQHADFVSNNPFAATRLLGKTQELQQSLSSEWALWQQYRGYRSNRGDI